jgi:AraC-like DNA-binding protein
VGPDTLSEKLQVSCEKLSIPPRGGSLDKARKKVHYYRMIEKHVRSNSTVLSPIRLSGAPSFYRCEPGWSWRPPPLPDWNFWLVLDGRGEVVFDSQSVALSAGSCFVFAPGETPHATQDDSHHLRIFACHFQFPHDAPAWKTSRFCTLRDTLWFVETARRAATAWQNAETVSVADGSGKDMRGTHIDTARCLLEAMLAEWQAEAALEWPSPRMKDVIEIAASIREAPGERWNVADLSRRAGLSPSQFTRRFSEHTGASPAHFVILTRLERARHLLRETDMTISSIADALGYHDVHFFCRQFKNFTGTTPGSLRK